MSASQSTVKSLSDVLIPGETWSQSDWDMNVISSGDCQSYFAWNQKTQEATIIDPKEEDFDAILQVQKNCGHSVIAVIDTHTHADHISAAARMGDHFSAPLFMNHSCSTRRVDLRVDRHTSLFTKSGRLQFILTPGHTPDGMCVLWGPFCFTGDTVLFNDCGRDDLPGGNPEAHYQSLHLLKERVPSSSLICPGHDFKGGRISSWGYQLKNNSSLIQDKKSFVEESSQFDAPAPALLKKALFENLR